MPACARRMGCGLDVARLLCRILASEPIRTVERSPGFGGPGLDRPRLSRCLIVAEAQEAVRPVGKDFVLREFKLKHYRAT